MHGGGVGVSGRMGENHGGLRTGWLAAFGTEGYEGEPPLMEELGVNFGHIKGKVCLSFFLSFFFWGGIPFSLAIIHTHPPLPPVSPIYLIFPSFPGYQKNQT